MQVTELIHSFLNNEEAFIPTIIAVSIVTSVVFGTIGKTIRGVARERTRREIAAYIAEGSMTPEQGERLLKVKDPSDKCG